MLSFLQSHCEEQIDRRGSRARQSLWRRLDDRLGPLSSDGVDPLPNGPGS